jgi:oxygen-dependent protoporphyrinogen oxidase
MNVVVVGGGITGLAAADRLARSGVAVTLLEASERLGGKVRTVPFAGRELDVGAEMLATRAPEALALCEELGLAGEHVSPPAGTVHLRRGRTLRPLPMRLLSGSPGGVGDLLRSRVLSPPGLLRMAADLVTPSRAPEHDVAIGELVRARWGREGFERLVDPLHGGIHAGSCAQLSAQALAPQLPAALGTGRGLIRGLRRGPRRSGPAFVALKGGLGRLTAGLAGRLQEAGADVRPGVAARAVAAPVIGGVRVTTADGDELWADACILATPAHVSGRLVAGTAPTAAAELDRIASASVAVVALAYPPAALAGLPPGTGFLTATGEPGLITACTWSSAKWRHLDGDPAIVKAFVRRADAALPRHGDEQLAELVHDELREALGLAAGPREALVERFDAGMPQYAVGHGERVARIEAALPPEIRVAGAAYHGVGVPACVRSGLAAAERVRARQATEATRRT